nr:hypothetical protein [Tanacetum cinerariifolium]
PQVTSAAPAPHYVIGFSQCTMNDAWRQAMLAGMKKELSFYPNVEFRLKDAHDNSTVQQQQLHEFLQEDIDLLIVSANEAEPITPLVEEAFNRGIPVVILDRRTTSKLYTAYVGGNNQEVGQAAGRYIGSLLGGKGEMLEVLGAAGSSPALDRHRGLLQALAAFPGVRVVDQVQGNWQRPSVLAALPAVLRAHPQVQLIFAHNDRMALGAYQVCKQLGLAHQVRVIGVDGLSGPQGGIQLVQDDVIKATLLYSPGGEEAIRTAMHILQHEPYAKENLLSTMVIDSTNVLTMKMQAEKLASDHLKIGQNLTVSKLQEAQFDLNNVRDRSSQLLNIVPVHTVDGIGWGGPVNGIGDRDNPVRLLTDNQQNRSDLYRLFGNAFADAEIIKGLHLRTSFGVDYSLYKYNELYKTFTAGYLSNANNRVTNNQSTFGNWVWQNTLNYDLTLGGGNHTLSVLLGNERISYNQEAFYASRTNFASQDPNYIVLDAGSANKDNGGSATSYRLASYFAKVNYAFKDRYLLSGTIRRDGSSRFGADNQFGIFPAVSGGWRISEENFLKNNATFVSDLKLRAGWGQTGNQDIANYASRAIYQSSL